MIFLPVSSFTPESMRWLVVRNRMEEAQEMLKKIAQVNGKKEPEESLEVLNSEDDKQRLGDFRDLFATRKWAHYTLLSWYSW